MSLYARENQKEWKQCPEGLHQAVCIDVIDLGLVKTEWGEKQKCRLLFQIGLFNEDGTETLNPDTDPPARFQVRRDFGLSLSEKSLLRPFLESWRGRKFTKEELAGFDLDKLLGVNCQLQIIHNITDAGKTYANIQAVVPVGRGMETLQAEGYTKVRDRGIEEHDDDVVPF